MMKLFKFLIFFLIFGCTRNSSNSNIPVIIDKHYNLTNDLEYISFFRKRLGDNLIIQTYKDQNINTYVFVSENGNYIVKRKEIKFYPDKSFVDTTNIFFDNYIKEKIKLLDELQISDVNSEFHTQGLTQKIYLKNGGILVYVKNQSKLDSYSLNYLKSMSKIDNNWYYKEKEYSN